METGVNPAPPPNLPFDAALRRHRHARAQAGFGEAAFLHDRMAGDIRDRVALVARDFASVLDLGGPRPLWPGAIRAALAPGPGEPAGLTVVADEDRLPFADASFDLVVSAGALTTVNDLPGALAGIRRALRPDGLFVAAFVGGLSLVELRACLLEAEAAITGGAGNHTAPMVEAQAAAGLLARAGFAMPVADVDRVTLRYASLFGLLADLRAMGARSVLAQRRPLRRDVLMAAAERFAAMAAPDGKTAVTLEILHLAGWAPGPGQPVPKARGSATTRLADALKSRV
jgi:SAM-dependent methyltransferase